jgi:hypothetical protein
MTKSLLVIVFLAFGSSALGQAVNDYQSHQTGLWNTTSTWEQWNGATWVTPVGAVPSGAVGVTITIQNTHNVTSNSGQYSLAGTLIVNSGGTLTIGNSTSGTNNDFTIAGTGILRNHGTLALVSGNLGPVPPANSVLFSVSAGGTLENDGTAVTFGNAVSKITFQSGGNYDHKFTTTRGFIPRGAVAANVVWSTGSNCKITGFTTNNLPPLNLSTSAFSNFIWDTQNLDLTAASPVPNLFDLNGTLNSVAEDLTISSTGSNGDFLFLTRSTPLALLGVNNMVVNGNLALNGDEIDPETPLTDAAVTLNCSQNLTIGATGNLYLNLNTANVAVDINGNLSNAGYLDFNGSSGTTSINLAGNFGNLASPGIYNVLGGSSSTVNITFDGVTQSLDNSIDFSDSPIQNIVNVTVGNGATTTVLNMNSNFIETNGAVLVNDASELNIGANGYIEGSGSLTMNDHSILRVASTHSAGAIQTTGSPIDGNLRNTGSRTFSAGTNGATIIYNGSSGQFLGSGHPTVANTSITNSSGVTLASNVTIDGLLHLISGDINVGSRTLTLDDEFIADTGRGLNITSASSIAVGVGDAGPFGTLVLKGGPNINNLTFNRPSQTFFLGSSLTVNGTLTHNSDINFSGAFTLDIKGPYVTTGGSLIGDASSTLIISGSGSLTGSVSLNGTLGTLTINRPVGITNTTAITIATALNILSGTYQGSGNVTLVSGATLTRSAGVITKPLVVTNYNLTYTNGGAINTGNELVTAPSTALNNLTIAGGNSVKLPISVTSITVNGTLNLANGEFDSNGKGVFINGPVISNATGTFTGSLVTFSGTTLISGGVALQLDKVQIASGANLNLGSALVNIQGDVDSDNGGTWTPGNGTLTFNGNTTLTISNANNNNSSVVNAPTFNNLTIAPASTLIVTCSSCGPDGDRPSIVVNGNWNSNSVGAVFTPAPNVAGNQAVKVRLAGANQSIATLSTHAFWDLSLSGTSTATLLNAVTVANDLEIGGSKTLSAGVNFGLNIGDDLIFSGGTFSPALGTVTFNGSANQDISGSGTANFFNLTVAKSAGSFMVSNTVNLQNTFSVTTNTIVDFDGATTTTVGSGVFTLLSTASRTAVIDKIVSPADPALVFGNVTVQRYMDGQGAIYRYISTPVLNPTAQDLQGEISITGPFTGTSFPCSGCGTNNQSMFVYSESLPGSINARYNSFPATVNTETMTMGRGYAVFIRPSTPITWNLKSSINKGDLPITTVSNSNDGWNLVGNPYPAPIDWSLADGPTTWTRTNIDPTIYIWDNAVNNYATYNRQTSGSTFGGSRYISMGQAYFIHASGAPTFTVREAIKVNGVQPTFFRTGGSSDNLRITLVENQTHQDQLLLQFNVDQATENFDKDFDAHKFPSDTLLSLYSLTADKKRLAINAMGNASGGCSRDVTLGLGGVRPGDYSMRFNEVESFSTPANMYLVDKFAGKSFNITASGSIYNFQVTADSASFGESRFRIVFLQTALNTDIGTSANNICQDTDATIKISNTEKHIQYFAAIKGLPVSAVALGIKGDTIILTVPKDKVASGENKVVIMAASSGCEAIPLTTQLVVKVDATTTATISVDGELLVSNFSAGNQWYLNGEVIAGATGKSIKPVAAGVYKLEVNTGACIMSTERQYVVTGDLNSFKKEGTIVVYPIPTSDKVTIKVKSANPVSVSVLNSMGVQTMSPINLSEASDGEKGGEIDLSQHASGIYILQIHDGTIITTKKILKR